MERDMTTGSPGRIIFNFTMPVFIGNVFQQFYSMVDTIIVGRFVGTKALAAVGSTGTIMFLILGFLLGLTTGFTVLTGQRFGAGDYAGMRKSVGSAIVLAAISSLLLTVISMVGMRGLLTLMNTPEDIFDDAYKYIMIICAGIVTQVAYNLQAAILRALGNSKTPLYFLLLSAGLNIVLDLLLIVAFHMGAAGAAYATVISQGVSAVLCFIYIIKKVPILRLDKYDLYLDGHMVRNQLGIGLPMALQYSITAIGTMMVQSALNTLGSLHVAAFTAATKIENIVTQMTVALGTTMSTYCAQNTGAGKIDRIRQGFRVSTAISLVYAIVCGALLYFFGSSMTVLFVSENLEEVKTLAETLLQIVSLFLFPLAIVNSFRNGIQGMGYGVLPMLAGVVELAARAVMATIASSKGSYTGICFASPVAWVAAAVFLLTIYFLIMRKQGSRTERRK